MEALELPALLQHHLRLWPLVLEARHLDYTLEPPPRGDSRWQLLVPAANGDRAVAEIVAYERENVGWRGVREIPVDPSPSAVPGAVAVAGGLAFFHGLTSEPMRRASWLPGGHEAWVDVGNADSRLMLYFGEWHRAATALTLHSDAAHLAGNAALGGVYLALAGRELGFGVALSLAIWAGILGNCLNAWFYGAGHRSIGASTAVFGILGAMTLHRSLVLLGQRKRLVGLPAAGQRHAAAWLRVSGPLAAGIFLLSLFGISDGNTDVMAHLFGFLAGMALGWGLWQSRDWTRRRGVSAVLGAGSLGALVLAWGMALW